VCSPPPLRSWRQQGFSDLASADEISLAFLGVLLGGYLVWLLYGISAADDPLIITDAVGLAASTITLSIAVRLRRRETRSLVG
jgi:uncharacterized protein with PQ loop repeat